MSKENPLEILIYCHYCSKISRSYFIGDCSHLFCELCINDYEYCQICRDAITFQPVTKTIYNLLISNLNSKFIDHLKFSSFQLNSAINLVNRYKEQLLIYKKLLKKAKEELQLCKKSKNIELGNFRKENMVNKRIENIYKMGRSNQINTNLKSYSSNNTSRLTIQNDSVYNRRFFNKK